jgi:AraC-like DNA-binding protein
MGLIDIDKKKYDSAMYYFKKALKVMEDGHEDYRVPEVINNIGLIYTRQGKNPQAVEYYKKSLDVAKRSNNRRAQALATFNIGNTTLSEKMYGEAERLLLQSLALAKETREVKIIGASYMALGQLKNETGKFDEAHAYTSAFYAQKDSLQDIERLKKIDELEILYETEKKEHTIQLLARDNRIQMLWMNILIVAFIFVAVLTFLFYYLRDQQEKRKRLVLDLEIEQLTTKNKELSEKYKDVLAAVDAKTIESSDQRLLKKIIEVVESNLGDPLFGVEQMAKEMGMSRTNMHRKIKAITGFPPSELIRNIRLRKAAALLLGKADSVSQISFIVGFEDHSYFSKSFKKQFGVTPSEYVQARANMN